MPKFPIVYLATSRKCLSTLKLVRFKIPDKNGQECCEWYIEKYMIADEYNAAAIPEEDIEIPPDVTTVIGQMN